MVRRKGGIKKRWFCAPLPRKFEFNLPLVGRSKSRSAAKRFRVGDGARRNPHPKNASHFSASPQRGRLAPPLLRKFEFNSLRSKTGFIRMRWCAEREGSRNVGSAHPYRENLNSTSPLWGGRNLVAQRRDFGWGTVRGETPTRKMLRIFRPPHKGGG